MSIITRTWKKAHPDTLWSIWDAGNEFWELKNGNLRHFSVIERYKNGQLIIEKVRLLLESPIPLEVVRQTILGWEVSEVEEVVRLPQQKHFGQSHNFVQQWSQAQKLAPVESQRHVLAPVESQRHAQAQQQAQQQAQAQAQQQALKGAFQPSRPGPAFLPDTPEDASGHPQPQLPSQQPPFAQTSKKQTEDIPEGHMLQAFDQRTEGANQCSQALELKEEFSQDSYTPPTELWSALSQWIPENALFQPSLHHQAFLELSGTQEKSYGGKKEKGNLQQKEARRPYVAPSRNSRPYQPKTFAQEARGQGPLFI